MFCFPVEPLTYLSGGVAEATGLHVLDLSQTAVSGQTVIAVFEALYRNRKSTLRDIRLSGVAFPMKEMPRLMGTASCSPSLTSLHLSDCSLPLQGNEIAVHCVVILKPQRIHFTSCARNYAWTLAN